MPKKSWPFLTLDHCCFVRFTAERVIVYCEWWLLLFSQGIVGEKKPCYLLTIKSSPCVVDVCSFIMCSFVELCSFSHIIGLPHDKYWICPFSLTSVFYNHELFPYCAILFLCTLFVLCTFVLKCSCCIAHFCSYVLLLYRALLFLCTIVVLCTFVLMCSCCIAHFCIMYSCCIVHVCSHVLL